MARDNKGRLHRIPTLLTVAILTVVVGCADRRGDATRMRVDQDAVRDEVVRVLDLQAEAWNRGDIDGFMEHYWKSDELTFSSGGRIISGWSATLDRYKQRYPTPNEMGRLRFEVERVHALGETAALVLGRYFLTIGDQTPQGSFSLVFERIDGRWCIIHDHTSPLLARPEPTSGG